jgi:predicted PurR-regulated permease PerM
MMPAFYSNYLQRFAQEWAMNDLRKALNDVSASSAGGAPFLITYGATFFITGILSFILPPSITALIAMFQGIVALPVAFWLERKMSSKRMEVA